MRIESFLGKHHSEETKKKISEAKKKNPTKYWLGKKMGPMPKWWRNKISKALKGKNTWNSKRVVTEETREKHRETAKRLGLRPPVRKGKDNNMWKGGITPINQAIRTSTKYKKWRESIFERDNYTCQICNKRGVSLRAHHIKLFCDFENWRMVPFNGITICKKCDLKHVLHREHDWEIYFYTNLIKRGLMAEPFGWELFCDCYRCDHKVMDNVDLCRNFLNEAVKVLGVAKQAEPYVVITPEQYKDKVGLSAWVPIVESGISCHTLSSTDFVSVDYYTCSKLDNEVAKKLLRLVNKYYHPHKVAKQFILRGVDYNK